MKNIIYRSYDKRYIGRKTINKVTYTVYAKTQLECKKKLQEKIKQITSTTYVSIKNKAPTLSEFWDKWYTQDKEPFVAEDTKKDILKIKKKLVQLIDYPINKISKDIILNYFNQFEQNRTKEKMHTYLNACLKSAVKHDVIKKNPYDLIILAPKQKNPKKPLTYEEQETLIDYIKNKKIKVIIWIYILTGLRKNELNFKSIENDINFKTNTLKAINLKGRNKVIRYKHIRLTSGLISLIMNNLDIIHGYDAETVYREFLEIMKELEIKKSIVNLRHTFATNHLYLGTPDYVISKEMGHSTSQITKDNYMDIDFNLTKDKIIKLYNNLYSIFL